MEFDHIWRFGDPAPTAAVAIARMPQGHTHVGIVYREGDGSDRLRLLHLAFHKVLRDDPIGAFDGMPQAEVSLPLRRARARRKKTRSTSPSTVEGSPGIVPNLPYGLSYNDEGCFEVTEESRNCACRKRGNG